MKLSDIMSAADLAVYAEIGLVLFLFAFLLVLVRVFWPGQARLYAELGSIPLRDAPLTLSSVPLGRDVPNPSTSLEEQSR